MIYRSLYVKLAESLNYCCPYMMHKYYTGTLEELAASLGVTLSTVSYNRTRFSTCPGFSSCKMQIPLSLPLPPTQSSS